MKKKQNLNNSLLFIKLLSFFLTSLQSVLWCSQIDISFQHITIGQGLSQNAITSIIQDKRGFIWFGTEDGLNRYDGYGFIIFRHDPWNRKSLTHNNITCLAEDQNSNLWIGTEHGLNCWNRQTGQFTPHYYHPEDNNSLTHNFITCLTFDKNGNLWVGTREGLNCLDLKTNNWLHFLKNVSFSESLSGNQISAIAIDSTGFLWVGTEESGLNQSLEPIRKLEKIGFKSYRHESKNPDSILGDHITSLRIDRSGNIWIGTYAGGLDFLDIQSGTAKFRHYPHNSNNAASLSNASVQSIFQDYRDRIWVGTENGLNLLDQNQREFTHLFKNPHRSSSLNNDNILSIYEDRSGALWVGTDNGINLWTRRRKSFVHYHHNPADPNSLSDNYVWALCEDQKDNIWIGTNGGLNRWNPEQNRFTRFIHDPGNSGSISSNYILSLYEDRSGVLWIGTNGQGLNQLIPGSLSLESASFRYFKKDPGDLTSIQSDYIMNMTEDSRGNFWIATFDQGLILKESVRGKGQTTRFKHYPHDPGNPNSISHNRIYDLYEAPSQPGILWIGTDGGGLNKMIIPEDQSTPPMFSCYKTDIENPCSISHNSIMSIYEDRSRNLWIATYGGGLNLFDRNTETFIHYTTENGLPNNIIYEILEDDAGFLWLSTNKGISRFNCEARTFKNYDINDGLQDYEFNSGASLMCKNGDLLFGGINGFNLLRPQNLTTNTIIPPVVITDLKLFHHSIPVANDNNNRFSLKKSITETKEVHFSYKQNMLTIEFASLNYICPEKNQYAYILENFERKWNEVDVRRFAPYSHLPPGEYVFKVKGSNNDGLWNEQGASLRIFIHPPFWKTWWFYTALIIFILTGISLIIHFRTLAIANRNIKLEESVEARTAELKKSNRDLTKALKQVKTLQGLMPICASCKKVRDDKGYWQQVEIYVSKNTDMEFSHGYCPDCYNKICDDLGLKKD